MNTHPLAYEHADGTHPLAAVVALLDRRPELGGMRLARSLAESAVAA